MAKSDQLYYKTTDPTMNDESTFTQQVLCSSGRAGVHLHARNIISHPCALCIIVVNERSSIEITQKCTVMNRHPTQEPRPPPSIQFLLIQPPQ